jgi:hypothetical protein
VDVFALPWPHPLIQLNPAFKPGETIEQLVDQDIIDDGLLSYPWTSHD